MSEDEDAERNIVVQAQGQVSVYPSAAGYVVIAYRDPFGMDLVKVLVRPTEVKELVEAIKGAAREILHG